MAIDVYLQIDGIEGESMRTSYPKHRSGSILTESVGLNYSKIKWKYTQQKVGGGVGGNTAGGWDASANKVA